MSAVKKCRSKTVPCPAGDRCPAHRGRAEAIIKALSDADLPISELFKKEKMSREETQKVNEFFKDSNVKMKKDGSTVITVNSKKELYRHQSGTHVVTVSKNDKQRIVVPAVHPADAVDKTHRIVPGKEFNGGRKAFDVGMQESLDGLYDGNVRISTSSSFDTIRIDELHVADEYKGHGVESHVLASVVLDRRPDLYDAVSKADVPYEEHAKAGFEPNPYYWADQVHPETGRAFPSVEVLDDFSEDRANPAYLDGEYYHLRTAKDNREYPYIRVKHGYSFLEIPLKKEEFSKEELKRVRDLKSDKWDRTEAARAVWNTMDIH